MFIFSTATSQEAGGCRHVTFTTTNGIQVDFWKEIVVRAPIDGIDSVTFFLNTSCGPPGAVLTKDGEEVYSGRGWSFNIPALPGKYRLQGVFSGASYCFHDFEFYSIGVGLSPVAAENEFKLMPNPASGVVQVGPIPADAIQVLILDLHGKILKRVDETATILNIPITDLSAGIYQVVVPKNGSPIHRKLVVE